MSYPGPTVYERDGKWYWADESWAENGPCETRDDAAFLQDMYVAGQLDGEPPPGDPADRARCIALGIDLDVWARNRPGEAVWMPIGMCNEDLDDRNVDKMIKQIEQSEAIPPFSGLQLQRVNIRLPQPGEGGPSA